MSADVWIQHKPCSHCGRGDSPDGHNEADRLNITYNLSKMLAAAGFCGWQILREMPARIAGSHILTVLDHMREDEDHWRAMNPPNGWGDYDTCLQIRMRHWAERCVAAGMDATIGGWL